MNVCENRSVSATDRRVSEHSHIRFERERMARLVSRGETQCDGLAHANLRRAGSAEDATDISIACGTTREPRVVGVAQRARRKILGRRYGRQVERCRESFGEA